MEEKTEVRHDPGWNDPPLFTYDKATAIQASATRKGALLNKRVSYPMTAKAVNSNAVTSPVPPDLPKIELKPPVLGMTIQSSSCNSSEDEFQKLSKSEKLNKVLQNLEPLIHAVGKEEISKRLKIMEKMWIDDKLDECVQLKLINLTEALCKGDVDLADHFQKGLMVDYVSQCSSWMSGIRQLINFKRCAKAVE